MVKNLGNGMAHLAHDLLQRATRFRGVRAVGTFLVGRFADAADGGQGAVQQSDYLAQGDLVGWLDQDIAAADPAATGQKAGMLQLQENLLQKFHRNMLPFGDVLPLEAAFPIVPGEFNEGTEGVLAFFGKFHEFKQSLLS